MREFSNVALSAVSAAASTYSNYYDAGLLVSASVQVVSTGTPTCTVKLQGSNDVGDQLSINSNPVNWFDIPSATVTLSAAGVALVPKTDLCFKWIRVSLVAGGTGSVTATLHGLGF